MYIYRDHDYTQYSGWFVQFYRGSLHHFKLKIRRYQSGFDHGGCFHIYFEFLAGALVIEAFLRLYGSIVSSVRNRSFTSFKQDLKKKFIPLLLRIILLLALGAILEVFWSTWWVYILTNHYVSWVDFYFGVNSALVH